MIRLGDFQGTWQIQRQINDRRGARVGTLAGSASFTPDDHGLLYTEQGTLQFPDQPAVTARQSYLWRAKDGLIAVLFQDARPFHHLATDQKHPTARHDCAPDLYLVRYDFQAWPQWRALWTVSGPAKDYDIVTHYTRST